MTAEMVVALVVGGALGVVLPALAVLLLIALAAYLVLAQAPGRDVVEQVAAFARASWRITAAGVGAAVAGHVIYTLLRTRSG
jgi:hypothetical protein